MLKKYFKKQEQDQELINIKDYLKEIITSLIVAAISWMVYTEVQHEKQIALIQYQLDQNNKVLQDIYDTLKDKEK